MSDLRHQDSAQSQPQRHPGARSLTPEQRAVAIGAYLTCQWKAQAHDESMHDVSWRPNVAMVFNLIRGLYSELHVSESTVARLLRAFEDDNPALVALAREAQPARQLPRPRVQIGNVDVRQHLQAQQQYLADLRKQVSSLRGEFVRLVTERVGDIPLLDSATGALILPNTEGPA